MEREQEKGTIIYKNEQGETVQRRPIQPNAPAGIPPIFEGKAIAKYGEGDPKVVLNTIRSARADLGKVLELAERGLNWLIYSGALDEYADTRRLDSEYSRLKDAVDGLLSELRNAEASIGRVKKGIVETQESAKATIAPTKAVEKHVLTTETPRPEIAVIDERANDTPVPVSKWNWHKIAKMSINRTEEKNL